MQIHTLKDIKRRVMLLLDQYSENGELINIDETFYADSDMKFNDTVDQIQRKISVTSRKLIGRASIAVKNPTVLAPLQDDDADKVFSIPEKTEAYIRVPPDSKTFSFMLNTEIGADIKVEMYSFPKDSSDLSDYEYGVPSLTELNTDTATKYEDKSFTAIPEESVSLTRGYFPSSDIELDSFIIKIISDNNYPAEISEFAAYKDFFSSKELIPEKKCTTARLPDDIIGILSVEKYISGSKKTQPLTADEMKYFDFSKASRNILTVSSEKAGIYSIVYFRYPKKITFDSHEDTEVELDSFAVDALIFGVAAAICPIENAAIIARMNSMFEEAMKNLYNTNEAVTRVKNKTFGLRKPKLSDLY